MVLLRSLTFWFLLGFLDQQLSIISAARAAARTPSRSQRNGDKNPGSPHGKFSVGDKLQCVWSGKQEGETAKVLVRCSAAQKANLLSLDCEYLAKPQSCPGYQSDVKGYWKQAGRALKRLQSKLCKDASALVKTGMCKRVAAAHFKLDEKSISSKHRRTQTPPAPTFQPTFVGSTVCTKRADHRRTAEELCSSSWASVCSFFLTMLQSNDC